MKTIKELEADLKREDRLYCDDNRGIYCSILKAKKEALKDVLELIDETFISSGQRKIDFKEELKAKINGDEVSQDKCETCGDYLGANSTCFECIGCKKDTKNEPNIEDKIMKKIIPNVLKFAESYVNTISDITGKPYPERTIDEIHGITIGEVRKIIRETIKNVNQNQSETGGKNDKK